MARFDVYRNPDSNGYLLDLQADLLSHLNTRLVAPLLPRGVAPHPARHLNPTLNVLGEDVVMVTQFMAAVPCTMLPGVIGNLTRHHAEIVAAVDFLMQGF